MTYGVSGHGKFRECFWEKFSKMYEPRLEETVIEDGVTGRVYCIDLEYMCENCDAQATHNCPFCGTLLCDSYCCRTCPDCDRTEDD